MNLRLRRPPALLAALVAGLVVATAAPAHAAGPPSVAAVSPLPAPVGTTVTISGAALSATTSVAFTGATASSYAVVDDSTVTATVPTGAVDGTVTVTTPDGSATAAFDVDEPPASVRDLTVRSGDGVVALRWVTPAEVAEVLVRRAAGTTAPAAPTDGSEVARGLISEVVDAGLANGTAYSYAVWTRDAAGTYSAAATATAVPAAPAADDRLRLGLSAATVSHGATVAATGVLTRADGTPLPGVSVVLLTRPRGTGSFVGTARATTDSAGVVRFGHRALRHTDFLLRRAGDAFSAESRSEVATLLTRHGLSSRVTAVVALGGTAVVDGRVGPGTPGLRVRLQRLSGAGWQSVGETALDARGVFRFAFRPAAAGEQVLRVVTLGDAGHLPATGPALRLAILARTLREGHSGSDVLALEHRLAALRYDVGPMSGVYDYDTRLAVMAFQKVQNLPRTGVADLVTRQRLASPFVPRLRYPVLGLSVEIDLTKQVLYFARSESIQRILPVSSGNNELYTVDGVTSRAVTPVGSFRITRKIDGIRVSRLGELFQPAYFVGGYAIHGSPSVPGYPASHGCVRVTKSAMSRLFPLLPVGTPVRLYY